MKMILCTFFLIVSMKAHAEPTGLFLSESLIGFSGALSSTASNVSQQTVFSSETGLGYVLWGAVYLGGAFSYQAHSESVTDSTGRATQHMRTNQYYGPSLGWINDAFVIAGTYYAFAEEKDNVTPISGAGYADSRTGSGFGVLASYRFSLGWFQLGPTVIYRSIGFTNCRNPITGATSSCSPQIDRSELLPYLTLFLNLQ
ncbi:MAG: hypothetical protein IT289_07090 [Oligoflexia bacterium]|nr:hypothetical protein [Oligoflexia bacterium]